jgi:hypothetical protein
LTRRTAIQLLATQAAGAAEKPSGPRWVLQYFYDKNQETFNINDFQFISATFGIAVGWVSDKKGKPKPMSAVTRDGGAKWDMQPLPDVGLSMFFLNDSLGWLVGEKAIWRTEEGGRGWKKLKIPKDTDVNRVYFRDAEHGWAVCQRKLVLETKDGGLSWSEVAVAEKVNANPEFTSYNSIEFVDKDTGVIIGSSIPPRAGDNRPAWMDPESASKRRELPLLNITIETRDGGVTWTPQTAPAFGQTVRLRLRPDRYGLVLLRFSNAFDWPSEVYMLKPKGGSTRVYREKERVVTDVAWITPSRAMLVAIEPPGRLAQLPIPGKLHVLQSDDMTQWTEMKIDYRAFGTRAMLSVVSPEVAWIATDTGQILRLAK